jgi:hypothetical protein
MPGRSAPSHEMIGALRVRAIYTALSHHNGLVRVWSKNLTATEDS